jgi:hypothetical protein
VVSFEPHPQPLSTEPGAPQAEEVPVPVAATEASITPPPPVPVVAVEEGEATTRASASREALATPTEAGPGGENALVVLREDSAAPPPLENRDAVTPPASELAQAGATTSLFPALEVPVPSPVVEVPGPSPTDKGGGNLIGPSYPHRRGGDGTGDVPVHRLPRRRGDRS